MVNLDVIPVVDIVATETIVGVVTCRCCVAGLAIAGATVVNHDVVPLATIVAIGTFTGVVICRRCVAGLAIAKASVVVNLDVAPAFGIVTNGTLAGVVIGLAMAICTVGQGCVVEQELSPIIGSVARGACVLFRVMTGTVMAVRTIEEVSMVEPV